MERRSDGASTTHCPKGRKSTLRLEISLVDLVSLVPFSFGNKTKRRVSASMCGEKLNPLCSGEQELSKADPKMSHPILSLRYMLAHDCSGVFINRSHSPIILCCYNCHDKLANMSTIPIISCIKILRQEPWDFGCPKLIRILERELLKLAVSV